MTLDYFLYFFRLIISFRKGRHSSPPKRKKKPKWKCKICGGDLGSFYPTIRAFFKVCFGIKLEVWERNLKELMRVVLHAKLPKGIKKNFFEALDILQTGAPPPLAGKGFG